jgi:glycosyltransferase involved in cell wall biosynthesis
MSAISLPAVTAVISTHNRCDELKTTLAGLKALAYPNLSVIVVDNDSTDMTALWLRETHPDITRVPHSDNTPLTGYNLGFKRVQTPYILVLDDDSCPRPGCLERMITLLEETPRGGAVAANIIGPDGRSEWGREGDVDFSPDWHNLIGCGFLVRQRVLIQTEGYDEAFGLYYNDLELAVRILSFGHQILYSSTCVVDHRQAGPRKKPYLKSRLMLRNFPLIIRSHFSGFQKLNLIAGHAILALWQGTKRGCFLAALHGFWQGLLNRSDRPFLRAPDSPGIRHFERTYALVGPLRRAGRQRPQSRAIPHRRKNGTVLINTPCYWSTRLYNEGVTALRTSPTEVPQFGCDCARTLSWHVSPWKDYQDHLLKFSYLSCSDRRNKRITASTWPYRPKISILTPVFKVPLPYLKECLLSVENQLYPNWELCVIEDGTGSREIQDLLKDFQKRHPAQVKLILRDDNRGIARTSQQALESASGEFIALLDHDDRLAPDALWEVVRHLNLRPDWDWIYCDNDKISPSGERWYYHFKPDWSPDLFLCTNYALHFSVIRRSLAIAQGGFRHEFEGSQDYDLYLRIADKTDRIHHIPEVLYSWREAPESLAGNTNAKPHVFTAGRKALADTLKRRNLTGTVEDSTGAWVGNYRIRNAISPTEVDMVSLANSVAAGQSRDQWQDSSPEVRINELYTGSDGETGGATLARALERTRSEYLLITCGDTTPITPHILGNIIGSMKTPGIAAWAAKIIRPDGTVDHCGLAFAPGGELLFPLRGLPAGDPAYGAYGALPRNVSAVTPVAVVMSVERLRQAGGFDPGMEATGALVGACFSLRAAGLRIVVDGAMQVMMAGAVYTPDVAMAPSGRDFTRLVLRYPTLMVGGDPYYNMNLRRHPADFGVWHA